MFVRIADKLSFWMTAQILFLRVQNATEQSIDPNLFILIAGH